MATVGVKELKDHLSEYLRRAKGGERIVVTERGKEIAAIQPVESQPDDGWMRDMVREGLLVRGDGKPEGCRNPPRIKGKSTARVVIEDRR